MPEVVAAFMAHTACIVLYAQIRMWIYTVSLLVNYPTKTHFDPSKQHDMMCKHYHCAIFFVQTLSHKVAN